MAGEGDLGDGACGGGFVVGGPVEGGGGLSCKTTTINFCPFWQ